ncbi:hypothetical protein DICPUDRAFT_158804 [Dictyostelium purpureum]|uniref:THIF-type NAD/FAD binding fold domain-containing protein n=1 Tax=Dictyostelium purpureum TaxID=5786 RepID=F1A2J1_DICPU|nr:uncharacterized protein DICPUDRAFT_158804 [Dictyostelium purpureum]EGC29585.1 hypothetical protein DICPUDRAFT_158804 [Dictyostelium purpureum]|eukprot:XP_003293887.1 hypothetical protein DICPUDRAFT_158804 [Dictyostelium purpureum]
MDTAVAAASTKLTEKEAQIYDRGIRLWGVDAQTKLRQSKVLFIGINSLMSEIIKNVVLVGVDKVELVEDALATYDKLACNLFLSEDSIGKTVVSEAIQKINSLNPLVTVDSTDKEFETMTDDFVKGYDLVVLSHTNFSNAYIVNNLCKKNNIPFILTGTFGLHGFIFEDLNEFTYQKRDESKEGSLIETHKLSYKTISESLKGGVWNKRVDPHFLVLFLLAKFEEKHNRVPDVLQNIDTEELTSNLNEVIKQHTLKQSEIDKIFKITKDTLRTLNAEVPTTCSVLGGIAGIEVIRILSRNGTPINNWLFLDVEKGTGNVEIL